MGCDIHFYVEKQNTKGKWVSADTWVDEEDDGRRYKHVPYEKEFYNGRNYNLFAILANVRNGRGFAGCKTGEGFVPIAQPRGVPKDACEEYIDQVAAMGADGHSHSWFTLRELLDYDWTQTTRLQGWVDFKAGEKWLRWGRDHGEGPESYCGGVSGGSVKHISVQELEQLCEKYRKLTREGQEAMLTQMAHTYAMVSWTETYYQAASHFWSDVIPKLLKLAGGVDGVDKVRIVFFFDN